jgi:Zn-dependent M28 family amino/carboxypeptidase
MRVPAPAAIWAAALCSTACSANAVRNLTLAEMPAIHIDRVLADIRVLASDDFGGRAPGSRGEELTVAHLIRQFTAAGAEPGNPDGGWVQNVPLVGITPSAFTPLTIRPAHGRSALTFHQQQDIVAFSQRVTEAIRLADSDVLFVGYGVQAPEYGWDDFKGVDVRGKTLVVLVNDPPVPIDEAHPDVLDPRMFNGRAMTYYGRWTYKFEKATELGAAAVLIVHETGPAGYGWNIVQGFTGERFDLVTPDRNMGRPAVEAWLSLDAATRLFAAAGLDFQSLKVQARSRAFRPVPLNATASIGFTQALRTVQSRNVIAKIAGADPIRRDEYVIYTAHWDHLGTGEPVNGDNIYNGARDNASGTAMLLEFARAFTAVQPRARRTILLIAVTAEEQGLLGSQYYAQFPLYPLDRTLAEINLDELNVWGRTRDLTIIGLGASDLDSYARAAAIEQQRVLRPDSEPEKGFYYRSDHFNFAKAGVPALHPDAGVEFIDKPDHYGQQRRDEWTQHDYHQPSDEVKDWWDLSGAAEDGKLLFAVGYRVANADTYPEWSDGSEFRAIRQKAIRPTQ